MAQQLFKQAFILSATQVVSRFLSFIYFIIIARHFGVEFFGKYYYVYNLIFLLSFISDFGLSTLIIREVAKNKSKAGGILFDSLIIRLTASTLIYTSIIIFVYFYFDGEKSYLLYILGLLLFTKSLFEFSLNFFQGIEKQHIFGYLQLINNGLLVLITLFFIYNKFNFIIFSFVPIISSLISAIIGYRIIKKYLLINFRIILKNLLTLIRRMIPFGLTIFAGATSVRIGIIILSWLGTDIQVGQYGVANRLIEGIMIVPIVINKIVYPLLSRYNNNSLKFQQILDKSIQLLLLLASLVFVIGYVFAHEIIKILYTNEYIDSVKIVKILLLSILASFSNYIIGHALFSLDKQVKMYKITFIILVISIILNIILVPIYGAIGIAISILAVTYATFIAYLIELRSSYNINKIVLSFTKNTICCLVLILIGVVFKPFFSIQVTFILLIILFSCIIFRYKNIMSYFLKMFEY